MQVAWRESISAKFRASLVASDWTELEAFAGASMRGLRHKVRHKIESVSDSRVPIEWPLAWRKMGINSTGIFRPPRRTS